MREASGPRSRASQVTAGGRAESAGYADEWPPTHGGRRSGQEWVHRAGLLDTEGAREAMGDDAARLRLPIGADLAALRWHVSQFALEAGLSGQRLDDLILAVNEATTNVLDHAGGRGDLVAWADDHGVWLDITDFAGSLTDDHLHGVRGDLPPIARSGLGLWVIRKLCDEVALDHPGGCSRLRLHKRFHMGDLRPLPHR